MLPVLRFQPYKRPLMAQDHRLLGLLRCTHQHPWLACTATVPRHRTAAAVMPQHVTTVAVTMAAQDLKGAPQIRLTPAIHKPDSTLCEPRWAKAAVRVRPSANWWTWAPHERALSQRALLISCTQALVVAVWFLLWSSPSSLVDLSDMIYA
jgi:hypothetical protein